MNKLFLTLAALILSMAACDQKVDKPNTVANDSATPIMVSFTDLKWTELSERKGSSSLCFQAMQIP